MFDENTPIVTYGPWVDGSTEYAMFERRCPRCGRLVKADDRSGAHEAAGTKDPPPNATCAKCGRVRMRFLGWTSWEEGDDDAL